MSKFAVTPEDRTRYPADEDHEIVAKKKIKALPTKILKLALEEHAVAEEIFRHLGAVGPQWMFDEVAGELYHERGAITAAEYMRAPICLADLTKPTETP